MRQEMTDPGLPRGFMVLQGNRLEDLCDLLVNTLQRQPLGPLEPEVMLVQSNGMKHWLELALARDDALGICAATRVALPSAFLWQAYRAVLGPTRCPNNWRWTNPRCCGGCGACCRNGWRSAPCMPRCNVTWPAMPMAASATSWPSNWPTCWTATRATAPTGWLTGSKGATSCATRTGRPCRCPTTSSGKPSCGVTCWPTWLLMGRPPAMRRGQRCTSASCTR